MVTPLPHAMIYDISCAEDMTRKWGNNVLLRTSNQ